MIKRKQHRRRNLAQLVLLISCFLVVSGTAQQINSQKKKAVYNLVNTDNTEYISRWVSFFEDKSGKLTFEEVVKQNFKHAADARQPEFSINTSDIWGRIDLTTQQAAYWYLKLDPASYNEIVFYEQVNRGSWKIERMGNAVVSTNANLAVNHYFLKLDIQPGDTAHVYFRVHDYYPILLDAKVGTLECFMTESHNSDMYNGLCYGIMLMALTYNFYLYFSQRNKVYLCYVLYVFFSLIFSAYVSGYSTQLPAVLLNLIQFAPLIPPAGISIFGLLFTLRLFGGVLSPGMKKAFYVYIGLMLINTLLGMFASTVNIAGVILQLLGFVFGVLGISSGIIAYRKRQSSAAYYLLGFGTYQLSIFYLILTAQGMFPASNVYVWHAMATGSVVESIMLSFALGHRVKRIMNEKEKAQSDSLFQARENARLVSEQNQVLEQKVKERTFELEEKNNEILDSIHYAQRIQQALLAHTSFLDEHLPEHFVFFKPKDIVSGDFYWAAAAEEVLPDNKKKEHFFLAVCDCTGHGVPGAFMSLLNISFLDEAVIEKKIFAPDQILDHVKHQLIEKISHEGARDGMDGILIRFDKETSILHYAAANNQPMLIRDGAAIYLPADKMPVGRDEKKDLFTPGQAKVKRGDLLYLYTDGFADQFGGPHGKKFKYKQLEELLVHIHKEPLAIQKTILEEHFNSWKGALDQVDDVLLMGIRL